MSQTVDGDGWALVGKDGRAHSLPHGMIFIGREECDIILQAVSADKRHAVVYYSVEEKEFLIKDLNSLTGTYVNGVRIPEQTYVKLKDLDCIRFGYGPDIFYLKRNVPCKAETQPIKPKDDVSAAAESRVISHLSSPKSPKRVKKPAENADATVSKELASQQKAEAPENHQPSLNRTDLPPDTLPLNVSANDDGNQNICDADGHYSDSPDYSHQSESSSCSAPANSSSAIVHDHDASSTHSSPAAMAFTVAFDSNVTTPRKRLGMRDGVRKFGSSRSDFESHHASFNAVKHEFSAQKFSSNTSAASSNRQKGPRIPEEPAGMPGKVQEAACFLIEKMLNTNVPAEIVQETMQTRKSEEVDDTQLNDITDDRSEAGTYTVEAENNDCDVEDARKRIDEVFGVMHPSSDIQQSHPLIATVGANKQIPCLNGHIKTPLNKTSLGPKQRDMCEAESNVLWNRTNRAQSRGRRIPTPSEKSAFDSRPLTEAQRARRCSDPPPTPDKSRRSKLMPSPRSPAKGKPIGSLKSPVSRTNNLSALPGDKSTSSGDDPSHRQSPDNRSDGSKSPHSSSQWQKVPWNLSGSDAELDQSKSENNSILSDTSTEPSSHSSHSSKNKPDHGPQMRLNRAFALRRARLEADSAKQGAKDNKALLGGQKAMKKSSKLSASTTTLRDDAAGAKNSLRLAPAVAKPFGGKPPIRGIESRSNAYKRKPELKSGHRRIESDPGKGIPVWRAPDSRPSTAGAALGSFSYASSKSVQKSPGFPSEGSGLQSFHRSMSCSIMNDAEPPLPVLPCSFVRSFEQNVMSGSQIVTGPCADDYQNRKHPSKELTALDSLVISAIHQLSSKLWANSKALLEKEREKCPKGGDCWLMIEEVLPSMPVSETPEDGDLTKDLSNILKNLKRVEQGLEVLSCVLDSDNTQEDNMVEKKPPLPQNFFIVDM